MKVRDYAECLFMDWSKEALVDVILDKMTKADMIQFIMGQDLNADKNLVECDDLELGDL